MVRVIGDYEKYLNYIDDIPVFSQDDFLQTRINQHLDFYQTLTDTRMFLDFIQNMPKKSFPLFNTYCLRYINEIQTVTKLKRRDSKQTSNKTLSKSPSKVGKRNSFSSANMMENFSNILGNGSANQNTTNSGGINESKMIKLDEEEKKEFKETFMIKPYFIQDELNLISSFDDILFEKYSNSCKHSHNK